MAERRRPGPGNLNGFLVAFALLVGGLYASGAFAAPIVARIDGPVTASEPADRVAPPSGGGTSPQVGGCPVFPADNAWNQDISRLPLHPRSAGIISFIAAHGGDFLHPDFGGGGQYGIPYVVVPASQPLVPITYEAYGDESDPGPFPIPPNAPVEGGSDRHVLVVQQGTCQLYELGRAFRSGSGWTADVGAKWDLTTGALRPLGWTSADAAGLPILPGLVRYDEVAAGSIRHAIRITFDTTQRGFVLPATHWASSNTDPNAPPMGLRLRLSASFDLSRFTGQSRVILEAMQTYGVIVADNGSNWYFQGDGDPRWDDDDLNQLKQVPGSAFEVVDTGATVTAL